ncbi:sensor histidine kinase [Paenibacillus yanchengensis]|uniref:histidine kinase n=1 Tax=Paenibacillus yanchengensis TaxID=2035833 RepID=A0ABW4YQE2_9BACL
MSLKTRITWFFILSTLVPFVCTAWLSYTAMSSILVNKLQSSQYNQLAQVQMSLENAYDNLNIIVQQLAIPGNIGYKLRDYLYTDNESDKRILAKELETDVSLLSFTSPTISLTTYYFNSLKTALFANTSTKSDFNLLALPLPLSTRYQISNFAPHLSNERYNNGYVISALQKLDLPGQEEVYAYVESSYHFTAINEENVVTANPYYLLLNSSNTITYSELPEMYPVGNYFQNDQAEQTNGLDEHHYWFKTSSTAQGWQVVSLIPKSQYNAERDHWVLQMLGLLILFIVITLILAGVLWKTIFNPLHLFHREMKWLSNGQLHPIIKKSNIIEFDELLQQFRNMKNQIAVLFQEVEIKEKKRADLEIEKLLYQINPHFLMNTLDTVHWLAVMNGQKEIDQLVSSLNKLLYYNLGKLGELSTIEEELESLKQYLLLQEIRYQFKFDLQIEAEAPVLQTIVPRFILQPIVENALYHGLDDQGFIRVTVAEQDQDVVISVMDNGTGISEQDIAILLHEDQLEHKKAGIGIGIPYVIRMLDSYFEGKAKVEIESELGIGTTIYLTLPAGGMTVD